MPVGKLAGEYRLTLVADSFPRPGAAASGVLRLRVQTDTLRRYYVFSVIRWAGRDLPDADVAKAGGWASLEALNLAYQKPDADTMLRVVEHEAELREVR